MSAKGGRLEALHTFAANVTFDVTDNFGTYTVTVTAGTYYLVALVAAIAAQLHVATITVSDGEGPPSTATGCTTMTNGGVSTFSVTWTSTGLRDALGFTANITTQTSVTSTNACPGLWLPGIAKYSRHGDADAGTLSTTFRQTEGPTGQVYSLAGSNKRVRNGILWTGVPGQRVRPHLATYTNETLEEFLGNTQYQTGTYASLFTAGSSIRIYDDADVDGTYTAGKFKFGREFDPDTMIEGWTQRYRIVMPQFTVGA